MYKFVLRRILILAPLLIMISFLVFSMIQLVPGDPVILMLGEYSVANAESIQALREQLGFDKPFYLQYWNYFTSLVQGDLGMSIRSKKPVLEQIVQRLPSTFELTLAGLGFAVVLGIFLGVVSALYHNRWPDRMAVTIALLGMSIPSFWLGLMLILIFSVYLRWLPVTGTSLKSLVLPALTLGLWAAGPQEGARATWAPRDGLGAADAPCAIAADGRPRARHRPPGRSRTSGGTELRRARDSRPQLVQGRDDNVEEPLCIARLNEGPEASVTPRDRRFADLRTVEGTEDFIDCVVRPKEPSSLERFLEP